MKNINSIYLPFNIIIDVSPFWPLNPPADAAVPAAVREDDDPPLSAFNNIIFLSDDCACAIEIKATMATTKKRHFFIFNELC